MRKATVEGQRIDKMIPRDHLSAGNRAPTIMSFPFWLAFGASGFVHVAAIAAVFTIVETEQSLAPKKLTVELVHESSFKTAPFTATAVHFPPIEERSHPIHEPIVLAERQPTLHLAPPRPQALTLEAPTTKPPPKPAATPLTTASMATPELSAQKPPRRSAGSSLQLQRPLLDKVLSTVKSPPAPKAAPLTLPVPSKFESPLEEPTPSSPEFVQQPKAPPLNTLATAAIEFPVSPPTHADEPKPQAVSTQITTPQPNSNPSQERTVPAQVKPMPALFIFSDRGAAHPIVALTTSPLSSHENPVPEFQSPTAPTKKVGSVMSIPETAQRESAASYKNPKLGNKPPKYPRRARRQGLEGRVVITVAVSNKGRPRQVLVAESSGIDMLDYAAVKAVEQWRFLPAHRRDIAVDSNVVVPIVFRLCTDEQSCSEHWTNTQKFFSNFGDTQKKSSWLPFAKGPDQLTLFGASNN